MDVRYVAWAGHQLAPAESEISVGSGVIEIEADSWQLIAIPVMYGYWNQTQHKHIHDGSTIAKIKNYVIDQIEDLYGTGNIEVCNTYLGDIKSFYSYIPGVTPESSEHNFQLVYIDNGYEEIAGFWLKSISDSVMTITWGD